MQYTVTLKETLEKQFLVDAPTEEQALRIVQYHYDRGDDNYILSSDDFLEAECFVDKEE